MNERIKNNLEITQEWVYQEKWEIRKHLDQTRLYPSTNQIYKKKKKKITGLS